MSADTERRLVGRFNTGHELYHLLNGAGVPYSVIENISGDEIASTETINEPEMIKSMRVYRGMRLTERL